MVKRAIPAGAPSSIPSGGKEMPVRLPAGSSAIVRRAQCPAAGARTIRADARKSETFVSAKTDEAIDEETQHAPGHAVAACELDKLAIQFSGALLDVGRIGGRVLRDD